MKKAITSLFISDSCSEDEETPNNAIKGSGSISVLLISESVLKMSFQKPTRDGQHQNMYTNRVPFYFASVQHLVQTVVHLMANPGLGTTRHVICNS